MNQGELHSGHRERAISKFIANPNLMSDHELLEILLFSLVPRKDTNTLAHKILRVFGSLGGVFGASVKSLMTVDGVGPRVASGLAVIGETYKRIAEQEKKDIEEYWTSPVVIEKYLKKIFKDYKNEQFIVVLLNARYKKLTHLAFEDKNKYSVSVDIPEIITAFAVFKPKFAIIAHNHPSENCFPSSQDDFTTKKLNILCEIHNVKLSDHLIITKNSVFSYFKEKRMEYIQKTCDLEKLLNRVKEDINE